MNLEELVQKLDNANPWQIEAVGKALGNQLIPTRSFGQNVSYTARELVYEEGLIIKDVELRVREPINEMIRLILSLSDNASCFPLERIKKAHPDLYPSPFGGPRGDSLHEEDNYWTKRPWGNISFGFKLLRPDCLSSITYIPKKWE